MAFKLNFFFLYPLYLLIFFQLHLGSKLYLSLFILLSNQYLMQAIIRRLGTHASCSLFTSSVTHSRFGSQVQSKRNSVHIKIPTINKMHFLFLRSYFADGQKQKNPAILGYIPSVMCGVYALINGITIGSGIMTSAMILFGFLYSRMVRKNMSKMIHAIQIDPIDSTIFLTNYFPPLYPSLRNYLERWKDTEKRYFSLKTQKKLADHQTEQYFTSLRMLGVYIPKRFMNYNELSETEKLNCIRYILYYERTFYRIELKMEQIESIGFVGVNSQQLENDKSSLSFEEFIKKYENSILTIKTTIPQFKYKTQTYFYEFFFMPEQVSEITRQNLNFFYAKAYGLDVCLSFESEITKSQDNGQ